MYRPIVVVAAIVAFSSIDFARLIKYRPPEALAHVNRWLNAMRARESVQPAK